MPEERPRWRLDPVLRDLSERLCERRAGLDGCGTFGSRAQGDDDITKVKELHAKAIARALQEQKDQHAETVKKICEEAEHHKQQHAKEVSTLQDHSTQIEERGLRDGKRQERAASSGRWSV